MIKSASLLAVAACCSVAPSQAQTPVQTQLHAKLISFTVAGNAARNATPASAPAGPAPTVPSFTTPDTLENPAVTSVTSTIYAQMRAGKIDQTLLTPELSDGLSPAALAQNRPVFDKLGTPLRFSVEHREVIRTGTKYDYLATFANEQLHVRIFLTPEGKVAGYDLGLAR